MRVLVTGGSGFVGRQCMAVLQKRGVTCLACGRAAKSAWLCPVDYVQCDVHDATSVDALLKDWQPSHCIHAAWCAGAGYVDAADNRRWLSSSRYLVRAFHAHGGQRFLGLGTCYEYADTAAPRHEEHTPTCPPTLYGRAKLGASAFARAYARKHDLSVLWCRLFYVFGPGDAEHRLVPSACTTLLAERDFATHAGTRVLDWMDVRDVAEAVVDLLHSDYEGVVNVASGQGQAVGEVLRALADACGGAGRVQCLETQDAQALTVIANAARLRALTGTVPRHSLFQSLRDCLAEKRELYG